MFLDYTYREHRWNHCDDRNFPVLSQMIIQWSSWSWSLDCIGKHNPKHKSPGFSWHLCWISCSWGYILTALSQIQNRVYLQQDGPTACKRCEGPWNAWGCSLERAFALISPWVQSQYCLTSRESCLGELDWPGSLQEAHGPPWFKDHAKSCTDLFKWELFY